jgi:hypothetical protein
MRGARRTTGGAEAVEWCHDWFQSNLGVSAVTEPLDPPLRGGSWHDRAGSMRAAYRYRLLTDESELLHRVPMLQDEITAEDVSALRLPITASGARTECGRGRPSPRGACLDCQPCSAPDGDEASSSPLWRKCTGIEPIGGHPRTRTGTRPWLPASRDASETPSRLVPRCSSAIRSAVQSRGTMTAPRIRGPRLADTLALLGQLKDDGGRAGHVEEADHIL